MRGHGDEDHSHTSVYSVAVVQECTATFSLSYITIFNIWRIMVTMQDRLAAAMIGNLT